MSVQIYARRAASAQWVDVTSDVVHDGISVTIDIDAPGPIATARIDRRATHPGGWAQIGASIRITADGVPIMMGTIGDIDTSSLGARISIYDLSEALLSRWCKTPCDLHYDNMLLGEAIQRIIDCCAADMGVVIYRADQGDEPYVQPYRQAVSTIWAAITSLAQQYAWRLQWRYIDDDWRLVLYRPIRIPTQPVRSIGPDDIIAIRRAQTTLRGIRNVVNVVYGTKGSAGSVTASDPDSISRYGERWMRWDQATPSALSQAQAQATAEAILADLHEPLGEYEIELALSPTLRIGDMIEIQPDGHVITQPLHAAITGIRHRYGATHARSTLTLRGANPLGGYRIWLDAERGRPRAGLPPDIVRVPNVLIVPPVLSAQPKLRGIYLSWSMDLSLYDQYDHTEIRLGPQPYLSQLPVYGQISGSAVYISHLADGSPIIPGTTYYVMVRHVYRDGLSTPWSAVHSVIAGAIASGDNYIEQEGASADIAGYTTWTDIPAAYVDIRAGDAEVLIYGYQSQIDLESYIDYDSQQDVIDIVAYVDLRIAPQPNLPGIETESRQTIKRRRRINVNRGQQAITGIALEYTHLANYTGLREVGPDEYHLQLQARTIISGTGNNLYRVIHAERTGIWAIRSE